MKTSRAVQAVQLSQLTAAWVSQVSGNRVTCLLARVHIKPKGRPRGSQVEATSKALEITIPRSRCQSLEKQQPKNKHQQSSSLRPCKHAKMSFTKAFEDLFKSFYELIASIFSTFYHILQAFLNAIINFFTGIVNLTADVFSGVVDVVGGVGKFVLGNIVIIGIIVGGGYAYTRYTTHGRQVAAGKKTA
ncbi:hypothetical protein CCHR01_07874 [Colletotrichum chrysophilum]|nr:hypothetical protein CCHR01_07874 [Colletotrichum chrysophilum]